MFNKPGSENIFLLFFALAVLVGPGTTEEMPLPLGYYLSIALWTIYLYVYID